jgi:hypothetical protein
MLQPTEDDEIMAELRRNREAIWARCGYDVNRVMEEARRCAQNFPGKRVSFKKEARERFEKQKHGSTK